MAQNPPTAPTDALEAACDAAVLTASPYTAPRYQFGMLLGVDDFDAAQAYPRGKVRLHNAWLHREGVVWGFGVGAPALPSGAYAGEIRVEPGLALDALGHELHLDRAACVDAAAWYKKQIQDKTPGVPPLTRGRVEIDARVEVRFRACLTRPVPAMSEPCDNGSNGVAFSRAWETVEIKLVPGRWERIGPAPYHLLRMLFGLEPAADAASPTPDEIAVAAALAAVEGADPRARGAEFLKWFRHFAALDGIALRPGQGTDGATLLFPGGEDAPIVLANVTFALASGADGALRLEEIRLDPTVRPAHVATSTIQELNLWPGAGAIADPDARGPRVVDARLTHPDLTGRREGALAPAGGIVPPPDGIEILTDQPLDPATVHPSAFAVTFLDDKTWATAKLAVHDVQGKTVTLKLGGLPAKYRWLRLIARGTGPTPLLGEDSGLPLAGAAGDPRPGHAHDGNDFVHMWKGRV